MIRFATQYAKAEVLAFAYGVFFDIVASVIIGIYIGPAFGILAAIMTLPVTSFFLLFFRNPDRRADKENIPVNEFLSPADGVVTDISEIDDPRVGQRAKKIGIFMSIFNVHVNRSPCYGKVLEVTHRPGEFLDARKPESSLRNESNDVLIEPKYDPIRKLPEKIVVRQIAGLLAKRIVCKASTGDELKAGQRLGMIKFGSRVELIVPAEPQPSIQIEIGQKVKAGNDVLIIY